MKRARWTVEALIVPVASVAWLAYRHDKVSLGAVIPVVSILLAIACVLAEVAHAKHRRALKGARSQSAQARKLLKREFAAEKESLARERDAAVATAARQVIEGREEADALRQAFDAASESWGLIKSVLADITGPSAAGGFVTCAGRVPQSDYLEYHTGELDRALTRVLSRPLASDRARVAVTALKGAISQFDYDRACQNWSILQNEVVRAGSGRS